jgi:hypothetical protein
MIDRVGYGTANGQSQLSLISRSAVREIEIDRIVIRPIQDRQANLPYINRSSRQLRASSCLRRGDGWMNKLTTASGRPLQRVIYGTGYKRFRTARYLDEALSLGYTAIDTGNWRMAPSTLLGPLPSYPPCFA